TLVFMLVKMFFVALSDWVARKMKLGTVQPRVECAVQHLLQRGGPGQEVAAGLGCLCRVYPANGVAPKGGVQDVSGAASYACLLEFSVGPGRGGLCIEIVS